MESSTENRNYTALPKMYIAGIILLVIIVILSLVRYQNHKRISDLSDKLGKENSSYKVSSDDHVTGNPQTAQIILINYSDTECPSCKTRHFDLKKIKEKYGDAIAIVSRYSPPPINKFQNSLTEAKALECASTLKGEDAYEKYSDAIYQNTEGHDSLSHEKLIVLGESLGMKKEILETCIAENKNVATKVQRDTLAGSLSGLTMVPSAVIFRVKDQKSILVEGSSYTRLINFIDATLR